MDNILLTGSTGYIGGRLLNLLIDKGYSVRCGIRQHHVGSFSDRGNVENIVCDVQNSESLDAALEGIDTAYYLVHSMGDSGDFEEKDYQGA
ncbi:MAG: NAD-dependent epimerase/dehydratase family protein [Planctomycetota bacterium]|nr:NAD-dependent epimerase/dehydratase family protein [Planctomycetota bacterium]